MTRHKLHANLDVEDFFACSCYLHPAKQLAGITLLLTGPANYTAWSAHEEVSFCLARYASRCRPERTSVDKRMSALLRMRGEEKKSWKRGRAAYAEDIDTEKGR